MTRRRDRTLLFQPAPHQASPETAVGEYDAVLATLIHSLTVDERQLCLARLDGASIGVIAARSSVIRTAIHRTIRGTSTQLGGMITKHAWVARWWQARQSLTHP